MKLFSIILLAFACAHAQQGASVHRFGWTPAQEYLYRFESQVLTGIPDINKSHYSGIKLSAQAKVQAQNDFTLMIKLDQVKFMTLNGEIELNEANRIIANGGPRSGAKEQLPAEFKQLLETPFKVELKKGLVEKFSILPNEHVAVTNIKRSLLAQLQLDVSQAHLHELESNRINVGAPIDVTLPYYSVIEQSLLGRCRTNYNVNQLTEARALELEREWQKEERMARLTPSDATKVGCAGKKYYEVIRTRDLNSCDSRPVFQKVSGADVNIDVGRTNAGNLMSHVDSTTTFVCGDLSSFIVRKVVVDDRVVTNPIGYNTEQTMKSFTRIMIELLDKKPVSSPIQLPSGAIFSQSLEYEYPKHAGQIPYEVVRETLDVLGTHPILPQPSLSAAPVMLLPVKLNKQEIIPKIVMETKKIAQELFSNPETARADENISGRILAVSKYMEIMALNDLETIWSQAISGSSGEIQTVIKEILLDTIAMVGTNPSTMFVLKKADTIEVSAFKANMVLQAAINNIQTPTTELLQQFVNKIKQLKSANTPKQQSLLTSLLLQVSNLFYHAYVNPETMVGNYPVRIYGVFGTPSSPVLKNEFIPALKQIMVEARNSQNKHLEMVVITALGKLGHHDAAKILVEVAETARPDAPIVRSLAVYSMQRTAKKNPSLLINVLMAIINNPQEVPEVRIAALSVLPWARPTYSELQQIAVRSWIETSRQVASFARAMLTNLQYTTEPELKPIAQKVRSIVHLLEPTRYGLQYSKHFDLSNFVEYLLASVSSRVSAVGSKSEPVPARIASSNDLVLEALGEGLKIRTSSFKLYSQGFETVIDEILKAYTDFGASSPETKAEINKIAQVINLKRRVAPQQMALVHANLMNFEYASLVRIQDVKDAYESIKQALASGELKGRYAAARNLVSMKVVGMTEAGVPVVYRLDNPTIFAASASIEKQTGAIKKVVVRPVLISKVQADRVVISPFTNEAVTAGVSMSMHAALPLQGKATWTRGEVDLSLMIPQETKQSGKNIEVLELRIVPYTARKTIETLEPMSQSQELKKIVSGQPLKQFQKEFQGFVKGNIQYLSDNRYVDFYSYLEKLQQHNVPSLLTVGHLVSSVKMASVKLAIQPSMCQLKEINLKLKLWARQTALDRIAQPIGAQPMQEIKSKGMTSVQKTLEMLNGMHAEVGVIEPATVIKAELSLKGQNSVIKSYEAFAVFGVKTTNQWQFKPMMAANVKLPQEPKPFAFDFSGNIYLTKFKARWNVEDLMQQAPELTINTKAHYGVEGQQYGNVITFRMKMKRSDKLVQSLRVSPEFVKCQQLAQQERLLAPICSKVRLQAGSYDTAEVILHVPQHISKYEVVRMIEGLFKASFWANYRPIIPRPQIPAGKLSMVFNVERTGKVANIRIENSRDVYELRKVRIPRVLHEVFPISARINVLDWITQKATFDMLPATCRVEPRHISTFDNDTYAYKIPTSNCEHVLMMDSSSAALPIAVVAKKQSGQEMIVKILAGKDQIQVGSASRGIEVLVNGQHKTIYPGQKSQFYAQDSSYPSSKRLVATIRRYTNEQVYHVNVEQYGIKMVTDGKRIELVAPQLLRGRTAGLCGNNDGEISQCVQSPAQCIMKPNLSAMSWMVNETASCSVKSVFPGKVAEYNKEIEACAQEENVPTSLTPILEKMMTGNGGYGLEGGMGHKVGGASGLESGHGMAHKYGGVSGGAGHRNFGGLLGCQWLGGKCISNSECCSGKCIYQMNNAYCG